MIGPGEWWLAQVSDDWPRWLWLAPVTDDWPFLHNNKIHNWLPFPRGSYLLHLCASTCLVSNDSLVHSTLLDRFIVTLIMSDVTSVALQASGDGLKKDVFLARVADLLVVKQQWIGNRVHKISDLMKQAGKMAEVSCCLAGKNTCVLDLSSVCFCVYWCNLCVIMNEWLNEWIVC